MRRWSLLPAVVVVLAAALAACKSDEIDEGPEALSCGYHEDCPNGAVCYERRCQGSVTCLDRSHCERVPVCEGLRCICSAQNRCLPVCVTDDDCPSDGHCVDGVCTRYPTVLDPGPPVLGARGALRAGVARVELDFPMGVSMAGYGARPGLRTPYRDALGGSNGWFDKPDVRALALDDGAELVVLLRIPTVFSDDFLVSATAEKVKKRIGVDLVDRIITSSPHSHSHPARFWHMISGLYFGVFGYDEFNFEIFDRMTDSTAGAVIAALERRAPARFGYRVLDDFDPEGRIHSDRRGQSDGLPQLQRDDRMVLMRVDDAAGQPIAILTNFGVHGTVFESDNSILTGDSGAGIEGEITRNAEIRYQRPVLGIFLQGNGGDISPRADDLDHNPFERIQLLGWRTWRVIEPVLDSIETKADVSVGVASGRVPIRHELLYGPSEFYDKARLCDESGTTYRYGAFQCGTLGLVEDHDPATRYTDGELHCVLSVECLTGGHPIPQFQKTRFSALRLGDLVLVTMPGEPLSALGRTLSDRVLAAMPSARAAAVLGYSQDHQLYLSAEDDWLQGGYEASMSIWGWKIGGYLVDRAVEVAKLLDQPAESRRFESGNVKPMYWDVPEADRVRVPANETPGGPEQVLVDVPERVERLDLVRFGWSGGHPGVDRPRIVLERSTGPGAFEAVRRAGGEIYDDSRFEMLVRYEGKCNGEQCREHAWRVEWEEDLAFPAGMYRFSVTGRAWTGGAAAPYEVRSRPFELAPTARLVATELRANPDGALEGRLAMPPAVELIAEGPGGAMKAVPFGHRMRSPLAPAEIGPPLAEDQQIHVEGTVRPAGAAERAVTADMRVTTVVEPRKQLAGVEAGGTIRWRDAGPRAWSRFVIPSANLPEGPSFVRLSLTDPHGNLATVTATVTR